MDDKTAFKFIRLLDDGTSPGSVERIAQEKALENLGYLTDSWVEFRNMTVPHNVDRPRARGDNASFPNRIYTQFLSAGISASRLVALQTGNDGLGRRMFYTTVATSSALGIAYLKILLKGDEASHKRWEDSTNIDKIADAIAWSGVAGIQGDKLLPLLASVAQGDTTGMQQNLQFATSPAIQSSLRKAGAMGSGFANIVKGKELTDYQSRSMSSLLSLGILDSTTSDLMMLGIDKTIEPGQTVDDILDGLFGKRKEQEGPRSKK
jgi:hypothetical protein